MHSATKTELQNEYHQLTGHRADGRLSYEKLLAAVSKARQTQAENEGRRMKEEMAKAAREERMRLRREERGTIEEFIAKAFPKDDPEYRFRNAMEQAHYDVGRLEKSMQEFAEKFIKFPEYTLSWSKDTFENAVKLQMYKSWLEYFEVGCSFNDLLEAHRSTTYNYAINCAPRSTSPTSNLIDAYRAQVYMSGLRFLEGRSCWI